MKPVTKQLTISAFILISVTILSFGIRQVRFSIHRANIENSVVAESGETTTSTRSSNREEKSQSKPVLGTSAEPDYYLVDSYTTDAEQDDYSTDPYTVDIKPDPQLANASQSNKKAAFDNYSKAKSFKGDYAKSGGSKDLEKILLGDNESLYRTEKGELWYVSKEADGSTTKMQVQVDKRGDMIVVDGGNYAKSGGAEGVQIIPLGDNENIYVKGKGELWYVSEEPDGSTAKVQFEEDVDGEIAIVDDGKDD